MLIIFTKFHEDWTKIVDFLWGAKKGTAETICGTGFRLGVVIKGSMKKKSSDLQTKNWGWYLGPPEPISKEFLSSACNTKILDHFKL